MDLDVCRCPALRGKEIPETCKDSHRGIVVSPSFYRTVFCSNVNKHGECSHYEKGFNPVEELILLLKKLFKGRK